MKGYIWENTDGRVVYQAATDVNTTGLYNRSSIKGLISTLPEVPGLMVYKAGHVGVYEGGGNVIEAKGFASGVVRSRLSDTKWTHWIAVPWISYAGYENMLRPAFHGPYTAMVITQTTPLNIRNVPSASGVSLAQVKKGDTLVVTGYADVIGWAKVQKDGTAGYSDAQYLQRVSAVNPPDGEDDRSDGEEGTATGPSGPLGEQPLYQARVVNIKSGLNLRTAPAIAEGNTIIFIPPNAIVDVYADGIGGRFALVQYGSVLGYCTRSYLQRCDGDAKTLYDVSVKGVTQDVVERIRSVYPGAVVTEAKGGSYDAA